MSEEREMKPYKDRVWMALYVGSTHGQRLKAYLAERGIPHYFPKMKSEAGAAPMFRNYLFAALDKDGLAGMRKYGAKVLAQAEDGGSLLDELKLVRRFETEAGGKAVTVIPGIADGQQCKIASGALKGLCGVIIEKNAKRLFAVNLEKLNQTLAVDFLHFGQRLA